MKKILLSTAVILSSLANAGANYTEVTTQPKETPQVATASTDIYGGIGFAALSTYGDSLDWFSKKDGQDKTGGIVGILGYQVMPNIAIEGRVTLGAMSTDYSESTSVSLFVKPSYSVTPEISLYGLLGFGWVKIDGKDGYGDIVKKSAPQFGLGASYKYNDQIDIFADYTWLLHDKKSKTTLPDGSNKVSHEAITFGLNYHF